MYRTFFLQAAKKHHTFPFLGANYPKLSMLGYPDLIHPSYTSGCTECASLSGWRLWAGRGAKAESRKDLARCFKTCFPMADSPIHPHLCDILIIYIYIHRFHCFFLGGNPMVGQNLRVFFRNFRGLGYRSTFEMLGGLLVLHLDFLHRFCGERAGECSTCTKNLCQGISFPCVYMTFDVNPGQVRPENEGNT